MRAAAGPAVGTHGVRQSGCGRVAAALEVVAAVAVATGVVAALQSAAPASGLGSHVSAGGARGRRSGAGELAALASAVLSVLTLNFFFITPRHQLAIAHTADLVELIVLLIAAVVVGRLAAAGRQRAAEAESRARDAAAREREAKLLAEAASAILAGHSLEAQLDSIGARVAEATGASPGAGGARAGAVAGRRRVSPCGSPPSAGSWLYVSGDSRLGRGPRSSASPSPWAA